MTYNTAMTIKQMAQLLAPSMLTEPLATMLANSNSLYRVHQPPLVSFCPMVAPDVSPTGFVVGCRPSLDGIRYKFRHQILPNVNGFVTIEVESGHGDGPTTWTSIYGPTAVATTAGTWLDHGHYGVIAAGEDRLRFSYTAPSGIYFVSHVLAQPDPDPAVVPLVAPWGQQASDFWPADDALLLLAGGPVHTEMLNRCLRNSVAVLRDRYHALGSVVQQDSRYAPPRFVAPFGTEAVGAWALVGKGRAFLPYQSGAPDLRPTLRVDCLAAVTAGATGNRVQVIARGANGKESVVQLDATGVMVVNTTNLRAELDGTANAGIDLEFYVRAEAGQQVELNSCAVSWCPGD